MKRVEDLFRYDSGNLYWIVPPFRGFTLTGKKAGTVNKGYMWVRTKLLDGTLKVIGLHRLVWMLHNGEIPSGMCVDHIDRNPLNNRIENLRLVSRSQNSMNATGKNNRRSSFPKNVYVDFIWKGVTKYRAQVTKDGVVFREGNFDTPEEAAVAATRLRERHHGVYSIKEADLRTSQH